jgi:hypothetical protein
LSDLLFIDPGFEFHIIDSHISEIRHKENIRKLRNVKSETLYSL